MTLLNDYVTLASGVICAAIGGELFVRGAVGLARWLRVSAGIVGATVAAFATSSPELTVSLTAAMSGTPQIALGDALGSNIVNVAVVLGTVLLISSFHSPRRTINRDFLVAAFTPLALGVLLIDGSISRLDGFLLLSLFGLWVALVIIEVRKQRSAAPQILGERRSWVAIIFLLVGLVFLVLSGRLIVSGATGIAVSFGITQFIIGATVVALGTSAPEIATAVVAKLRGHDEVGLGTVLGSNIFNGLFIIGIAAIISPMRLESRGVVVALAFGLLTLAAVYPRRDGSIGRARAPLLLLLYFLYVLAVI